MCRSAKVNFGQASSSRKRQDEECMAVLDDGGQTSEIFDQVKLNDLGLIPHSSIHNEAITNLFVQHQLPAVSGLIRVKVDTGAGRNILPKRTFKQMFGHCVLSKVATSEPRVKLTEYSGNTIPCLGSIRLDISKSSGSNSVRQKFYVVDVAGPVILSLPTCQLLNLVQLNLDETCTSIKHTYSSLASLQTLQQLFPDCFDGTGCLQGKEKLYLKEGATPFIHPPRRYPLHLQERIKEELESMESQGIICKMNEHMDWCSSLTYLVKKNGKLRMCLLILISSSLSSYHEKATEALCVG